MFHGDERVFPTTTGNKSLEIISLHTCVRGGGVCVSEGKRQIRSKREMTAAVKFKKEMQRLYTHTHMHIHQLPWPEDARLHPSSN